jgi:hypothetical protein
VGDAEAQAGANNGAQDAPNNLRGV